MANYWMVGSYTDTDIVGVVDEDEFVAIGFGGVEIGNIGGLSNDQIRERVRQHKPDATTNQIGSITGNLYRFAKEIEVGDWVLTSVRGNSILIGLITSKYTFVASRPDRPHQRTVKWIHKAPLDGLSEHFRCSLGSQLTFFSVNSHAKEIGQLVEA